jgi:hypothetical protein
MELRQGIQAEAQAHPLLVARTIGVYRPVGVEEMPFDPGVTLEDQLAKLSEVREPVLERGVLEVEQTRGSAVAHEDVIEVEIAVRQGGALYLDRSAHPRERRSDLVGAGGQGRCRDGRDHRVDPAGDHGAPGAVVAGADHGTEARATDCMQASDPPTQRPAEHLLGCRIEPIAFDARPWRIRLVGAVSAACRPIL